MKIRTLLRTAFSAVFLLLLVGTVVYMLTAPEREDERLREELGDPLAFVTDTARTPWVYANEDGTLRVYHEDCYHLTVLRLPEMVNGLPVSHLGNACSVALPNVERLIFPSGVTQPKFDGGLKKWTALAEVVFREGCVDLTGVALYAREGLEAVYLPRSLTTIGWHFMREGDGTPTLYYAGTEEEWVALGGHAKRLAERYTVVFEAEAPTEWLESTK